MSSVRGYLCYPELGNLSCTKHILNQSTSIYLIVLFIFAFCSGLLNLVVVIAISHFRQLHSSCNFILLNLAVSDFLVCCLVVPIEGAFPYFCWRVPDILCSVYTIVPFTLVSVSVGDMILISIDRYVAICDPMHYPTRMCRRSVSIALIACWIFSLLYGFGYYHNHLFYPGRYKVCEGSCSAVVTQFAEYLDLALNFCGPFVLIVLLYARVFFVAVSQARAMHSHVAAMRKQATGSSRKSELKAARNLGFVVLLFLFCYTPFYVLDQDLNINIYTIIFLFNLMYLNSCLNPILYAVQYPWFRKTVKQIVTLKIFQSGSRDANVL